MPWTNDALGAVGMATMIRRNGVRMKIIPKGQKKPFTIKQAVKVIKGLDPHGRVAGVKWAAVQNRSHSKSKAKSYGCCRSGE